LNYLKKDDKVWKIEKCETVSGPGWGGWRKMKTE